MRYYPTPQKTIVQEEYIKEDRTGLLTGWSQTETSYTKTEDNNQIIREAYSLWNYEKHQWEYALCRTHCQYSPEEEEWLFEKFDTGQAMWQKDRLVWTWQSDEKFLYKEEQRWNTKSNDWVPYHRIINSPRRITQSFPDQTAYQYDERSETWIPWFRHQGQEEEKRTLYSQWNSSKEEWENYAVWQDYCPEDPDQSQALFWDPSGNTWIEKKEWNDWSLPYYLREYFVIEVKVDYDTMVRKNYQSKK